MRFSRHLLVLALLAAALCSDRDAALAGVADQPRSAATQGLIRRLSARLRAAIVARKLRVDRSATGDAVVDRSTIQPAVAGAAVLQSWLLNLPPPAAA